MTKPALVVGTLALLTGCLTHRGTYDPEAFAPWRIAQVKKIEGRALILTTAEDDAFMFSGRPKGIAGFATTLTLPLGVITREAAVRVFGELFLGGAEVSNDASRLDGYRAVISPRTAEFAYEYEWFTVLEVSVHVALHDARGQVAFERTYDSGRVKFQASAIRDPPVNDFSRAISRATHVEVQRLLLRAAADVRAYLEGRAPPGEPSESMPHGSGVVSP